MTTDNKTMAVDVLAVIMESADFMREDGYTHRAIPLEEAHAAFAELVEAATVIDERISYYSTVSNGVSKAIETWNAEEMRRFRDALARVKGESA